MSLKDEVLAALAAGGLSPLHRFGQNFMIDGGALQTLVQELALTSAASVVEVGPGTGVLTQRLLDAGARVTAVEIDRGLHQVIATRFAAELGGRLALVHGDCLETKNILHPAIVAVAAAGPWRLGANLPCSGKPPSACALAQGKMPGVRAPPRCKRQVARACCENCHRSVFILAHGLTALYCAGNQPQRYRRILAGGVGHYFHRVAKWWCGHCEITQWNATKPKLPVALAASSRIAGSNHWMRLSCWRCIAPSVRW
jgi:NAD-dependent dihydropyrimidine dehydrogenase PreA subunit